MTCDHPMSRKLARGDRLPLHREAQWRWPVVLTFVHTKCEASPRTIQIDFAVTTIPFLQPSFSTFSSARGSTGSVDDVPNTISRRRASLAAVRRDQIFGATPL